jgi:hypothetical protein
VNIIFKFADVAVPIAFFQFTHIFIAYNNFLPGAYLLRKCSTQQRNIVRSFAKRRYIDPDNIKSVEEILRSLSFFHFLFYILFDAAMIRVLTGTGTSPPTRKKTGAEEF